MGTDQEYRNLTQAEAEADAAKLGVVPGATVTIHRWMFPELTGTVDFVEPQGDGFPTAIIGIVGDDSTVYALEDVTEVNAKTIEGGGAW